MSRLLVLAHSPAMSGGEIALMNQLRHGLADEVVVATETPGPLTEQVDALANAESAVRTTDDVQHGGVSHGTSVLTLASKFIAMRKQYRHLVKSRKWDAIYANTIRSALVASTVPKSKVPLVFHLRDRMTEKHIPRIALPIIKLWLGLRTDTWIANSHGTAKTIPQRAKRVNVCYSPVDDAFFDIPLPSSTTETIHIALIGRLARWKGQKEFISALAELDKFTSRPWKASIVGGALFGESDYVDELGDLIKQHGLDERVTMTGHVDQVNDLMETVDVVAHCSTIPEPFGQVVAQGMAAGRAVVAANTGGPVEIINPEKTGLLVDPTSPTQLAEQLARLINDPSLRLELGRNARIDAERFRAAEVTGQIAKAIFR